MHLDDNIISTTAHQCTDQDFKEKPLLIHCCFEVALNPYKSEKANDLMEAFIGTFRWGMKHMPI